MSDEKPVDLVDAGVPADQGLSALGMLMQLAGSVLAAYVSLFAFILLFSLSGRGGGGGSETMFMFLILGLCIGRSLLHRSAGATLLYGDPNIQGGRMRGVQRYITFALAQSAILGVLIKFKFEAPGKVAFAVAVGLALWPGLLAGMLALPRFRRFKDELPITEDKGFEGASILMTVLGLCGLIGVVAALILCVKMPGGQLTKGVNILLPLSLILLVVRSVLHVQAGLSGLRETSVDKSVELANRYANFGVISSFCVGGALLLFIMAQAMSVVGLTVVCGVAWMLLAWPMIVRRFFSDRQFADLLAGDQAPVHRRSPDAGLTWLGWLLIAYAAMTASFVIPQLILGVDGGFGGGRHRGGMDPTDMMGIFASVGLRSIWWSVGLLALQGWAGFELVRMSPHSRMIATVFGAAGVAITVYINWPMMQMLRHGGMGATDVVALAPLALALVLPVATLLLVNRKIAPTAQARFRSQP